MRIYEDAYPGPGPELVSFRSGGLGLTLLFYSSHDMETRALDGSCALKASTCTSTEIQAYTPKGGLLVLFQQLQTHLWPGKANKLLCSLTELNYTFF